MNMPNFDSEAPQSGSGGFSMDNFDFDMDHFDSFQTGQFLDQDLQPSYANAPPHTGSVRPSDLDANPFNNMGMFGASHPAQLPLQIDPALTESRDRLGQKTLAHPLTPSTSLSPERFDAVRSRRNSFTDAAATRRLNTNKKKFAGIDDGDADAERRSKNRVAASKCRVKKKGREQLLIQESDQKEQENLKLRAEYRRLTQEALWFKNQLITHGNCGDPRINQWLTNSAAKIVHKFGEAPALQRDSPSRLTTRPPAELAYERRDSGISTNSKADSKVRTASPPLAGHQAPVKIDLGSPVDDAGPQDLHAPTVRLKVEPDSDLRDGKSARRTRSLDHSTLDALAIAAAIRAQSVPLQEFDVHKHAEGDAAPRESTFRGEVSGVPPSASVSAAPSNVVDSTEAVLWDAQLSATVMSIDPRLRGGDVTLEPLHADSRYFHSSMQQDEHSHDELLQIPETRWMEA